MNRALLSTLAVVVGAACGRQQQGPPQMPPPPDVGIVTVTPQTLPVSYEFVGQVTPFRRVEVRARVDGIIEDRPFTEGAVVTHGQVLYRLDRVRYEAAYQSALARYDNAKRTLERLEPLLPKHAVAQQDVDNAHFALDAAKGDLDQAKKDLDDTVVRAEIAGRVGRTHLDLGARVTGPADLLNTIDQLDPVYVTFRPSTQQLLAWAEDPSARSLIQAGSDLTVRVVLPDGSLLARSGSLDFVAPSVDSATGTQEFRARFDNPNRDLLPGQFVRVRLVGFVRAHALAVPQRAVQQGLGRQFVYVVGKGDTAVARDVQPGTWSGDLWIIEQGLAPGDRVIVDGTQKVGPGRPVHPSALSDSASHAPAAGGAKTAQKQGAKP